MSRIQLALNVEDLQASITFYSALFGAEPAKVRPGYANFAMAEPPLKLVLIENPGQGGSLNHLGVEVADVEAVDAEQSRLAAQGLATIDERGTTCCYAKQDKFWVEGTPNGERWEVHTVLADSPTFRGSLAVKESGCCGDETPLKPPRGRASAADLSPRRSKGHWERHLCGQPHIKHDGEARPRATRRVSSSQGAPAVDSGRADPPHKRT